MDVRDIPMWHDAKLDPPGKAFDCETVLIVEKKQNGKKQINFGKYVYEYAGIPSRWVTYAGKTEVLFWMPLPKMPKVGTNVITHTEYAK